MPLGPGAGDEHLSGVRQLLPDQSFEFLNLGG
jgi:hypothetical protein